MSQTEYQCVFLIYFSLPPVLLSRLDYPRVGLRVPVRVGAFVLFCLVLFYLRMYTPVPLFAVFLRPFNQEATSRIGDGLVRRD